MSEYTFRTLTNCNIAHSTMAWALVNDIKDMADQAMSCIAYMANLDDDNFTGEHSAGEHYSTMVDFICEHMFVLQQITESHDPMRRELMHEIQRWDNGFAKHVFHVYIMDVRFYRKYNKH